MPIPYIPLDEVYRDRREATVTLKACCLVSESRTFLAPARERLYRTLALEIIPSEKDMNAARHYPSRPVTLELSRKQAKLLPSLALSPILPTLPRRLSFEIFLDFDTGLGKKRYRAEAPESLLATILSLCPNITSLPLYIDTSVGVFAKLSNAVIQHPALTSLELFIGINGEESEVDPNDLSFGEPTANLLRGLPHLQRLELHGTGFVARDVVNPVSFPLITLDLGPSGPHSLSEHTLPFLTSASANTLVSATLHSCPSSISDDVTVYNVSPFASLSSLVLYLHPVPSPWDEDPAPLVDVADFWSQTRRDPLLGSPPHPRDGQRPPFPPKRVFSPTPLLRPPCRRPRAPTRCGLCRRVL